MLHVQGLGFRIEVVAARPVARLLVWRWTIRVDRLGFRVCRRCEEVYGRSGPSPKTVNRSVGLKAETRALSAKP